MLNEVRHRLFTNGFVAVLSDKDNRPVETTATCLPLSTELRLRENVGKIDNKVDSFSARGYWSEKWMIGVSTSSGCPVMCKFCACNKVTEKFGWRVLTDIEIVQQVFYAETRVKGLYGDKIEGILDPRNAQLFRILFTRMGEPAYNIENVLRAIKHLKREYPNARIQISTIGVPRSAELVDGLLDLEEDLGADWLELQFSIHSTDNAFRKWLLCKNVLQNEEIGKLAEKYYYARPRKWKVTLNFALAENTPFNPKLLPYQFDKDACFVKLSPINENIVSRSNDLKTLIHYKNTI